MPNYFSPFSLRVSEEVITKIKIIAAKNHRSANKEMLLELIPFKGVKTVCGAKVTGYKDGKLTYEKGGETVSLPADSVILAVGYREEKSLYEQLQFEVPDIYLLGDAKNVSNIMYAIWDAFEVANHLD